MKKNICMVEASHPLANVSLEDRLSYLKAVAIFVAMEDVKKIKFTYLIKLLECEDVQEDLFVFLDSVDEKQALDIFTPLQEKYRVRLAIDIIYTFDVKITKCSNFFVDKLLKVSRAVLSLLQKFFKALKNGNSDKINAIYLKLFKYNTLFDKLGEFAKVYNFEYEHSLQDMTDDFIFAGRNNHQKRYQPKYMDTLLISENREIMLYIVRVNGMALQYAYEYSTREDEEVCLAAVKQNKDAIEYVSDSLKDDKDIQAVLKNNREK